MHIFANPEIFVLHPVADVYRFIVVVTPRLAHVAEIEIENHAAVIGVYRDDIVGIHVSLVAIDHQVRILPEIPGTIAFPRRSRGGIFVGSHHRAGLQAKTIFVFDGVLLVIEHGV